MKSFQEFMKISLFFSRENVAILNAFSDKRNEARY